MKHTFAARAYRHFFEAARTIVRLALASLALSTTLVLITCTSLDREPRQGLSESPSASPVWPRPPSSAEALEGLRGNELHTAIQRQLSQLRSPEHQLVLLALALRRKDLEALIGPSDLASICSQFLAALEARRRRIPIEALLQALHLGAARCSQMDQFKIGLSEEIRLYRETNAQTLPIAAEDDGPRVSLAMQTASLAVGPPIPFKIDRLGMEEIRRADMLRNGRHFDDAKLIYSIWARPEVRDPELRLAALEGLRLTLRLEDRRDLAVTVAKDIAELAAREMAPETALRKSTQWARAKWTERNAQGADTILQRAISRYGRSSNPSDALFVRARIAEQRRSWDQAIALFARAARLQPPGSEARLRTLWSWAWTLRQRGDRASAISKISELLAEDSSSAGQARARFWRGKWRAELSSAESADDFDWILANEPTGYYGLLVHRERKIPLPPLQPAPTDRETQNLENLRRWSFALALPTDIELGARAAAQRLALNGSDSFARLGFWAPAIEGFGRATGAERLALLTSSFSDVFPRPWRSIYTRAADEAKLPIELLYSISRQESSFRVNARSSADAMGLMQLLPLTAERLSRQHGLSYQSPDDLFHPEINVPLAARLLRELLDMYSGNFILAVATYNASERYVRTWVERRLNDDPLEFIEEIPFEETRGYVRLVIRNYTHYLRQMTPSQAMPFPEWCLQPIQPPAL